MATANGNGTPWWKTALMAGGTVVAGAALTLTGVNSRLDETTRDVVRVQLQQEQQGEQLDRLEQKLDRILRESRK